MMTRIQLVLYIAIIFNGCGPKGDAGGNSYSIIDLFERDDCKMYVMEFQPGQDFLFRIATSGSCKNLTSEEYILSYRKFLSELYTHEVAIFNQKIRMDYPSDFLIDKNKMIDITKERFNCSVSVSKTWDDGIELLLTTSID